MLLGVLFWRGPDTLSRNQSIYEAFGPLAEVRATIKNRYVKPVTDDELLAGAIEGILRKLDRHCRYIKAEDLSEFIRETSGEFHGIGIYLDQQDGNLTVLSPMKDSPAHRAGIMAGDQVLKVDGKPTESMSLVEAAKLILGPAGTEVILEVRHVGTGGVETFRLQRGPVRKHSVRGYVRNRDGEWKYLIDKRFGIAYVLITEFLQNTAEELDRAYYRPQDVSVRGLIIDLRRNPGGTLQSAVAVADRFIDHGPIVSTQRKETPLQTIYATTESTYKYIPVVVLINKSSASAAEIVAGALQDTKRATLIGERSYGKGSVQEVIKIDGGREGAIKLTTAYYYLPSGRNIDNRHGATQWGIDPDIEIKLSEKETIALIKARKQSLVIYGPANAGPSVEPPEATTQPASIAIDRQLARALEVLREKLAPTQTDPATQPVAGRFP